MEAEPVKLCTSCKHHSWAWGFNTCSYKRSQVDGSAAYFCDSARSYDGHCKREAVHHEQVQLGAAEGFAAAVICASIIGTVVLAIYKTGA